MLEHLGDYDPSKEGVSYLRWYNVQKQQQGKLKSNRIPFFLNPVETTKLDEIEPHVPFESLFTTVGKETRLRPSLDTFLARSPVLTRQKYQDHAERLVLNQKIYYRAVANSAKTMASMNYLSGLKSRAETEKDVSTFVNTHCELCSESEKEDFLNVAMNYVDGIWKGQREKNLHDVTVGICLSLHENGYLFSNKPAQVSPYAIRPDNTRTDGTMLIAVKKKNLEALQSTVFNQTLGNLLLTKTLHNDNGHALARETELQCTKESLATDEVLIRNAIIEAKQSIDTYFKEINSKISTAGFDPAGVVDTLEYFVQTNVSASSEAVMTFPQGMNHVLTAIKELDRDAKRRKRIDQVVCFGGMTVGIALTVFGVTAPEGAALLLTIGAIKGVAFGTYYAIRTLQEKKFYNELQTAKSALGPEFLITENFDQHYRKYRALRLSYMMEFAGSAANFASLHSQLIAHNSKQITVLYLLMGRTISKLANLSKDMPIYEINRRIIETLNKEIKVR